MAFELTPVSVAVAPDESTMNARVAFESCLFYSLRLRREHDNPLGLNKIKINCLIDYYNVELCCVVTIKLH